MLRSLLVVASLVPLVVAPPATRPDDDRAPLRLTLQIDGANHELLDDQEVTITVAGKEVRAKASVQPTRRFEAAGLRFDFPRDMKFEHDPDGMRWKFDGDKCDVRIHWFSAGEPAELARIMVAGMLQRLDEDAAPPQPCELQLGGLAYAGLRGRARMDKATLEVAAVGLSVGGKPFVFMLQDFLGDDGKLRAESQRMLELLRQTFVLTGAK